MVGGVPMIEIAPAVEEEPPNSTTQWRKIEPVSDTGSNARVVRLNAMDSYASGDWIWEVNVALLVG